MIRTGTTWKVAAAIALIVAATSSLLAQGITTGAISGKGSTRMSLPRTISI